MNSDCEVHDQTESLISKRCNHLESKMRYNHCGDETTGQSADRATVIRSDPARWRERGSQSSLGVSTRRCTGPVKKLKFFL
ncbi:hypothetical protein J6590_044549 [Homalodisca vitripennis]|nr:hypothetical protein J6590_044549 [Homalodisca vitripennis]